MYIRGFDLFEPPKNRFCLCEVLISPPTLRRAAICEVLISLSQLSACSNARGFDLSAGRVQRSDSRGLYLSPTCGIPKTRSKPRKWGDTGEAGDGHQM